MNPFAAGVAFAVIWACVFLASLPWMLRPADQKGAEAGVEGEEPGAPGRPHLLRKTAVSLLVALVLFVGFVFAALQGWFNPETWPTWDLYPSSREE